MKYRIASNEIVFAEKTVYYREYRKAPKYSCLVNRKAGENQALETFEYVYHSPNRNELVCIYKHHDQPKKVSKLKLDDDLNPVDSIAQAA